MKLTNNPGVNPQGYEVAEVALKGRAGIPRFLGKKFK